MDSDPDQQPVRNPSAQAGVRQVLFAQTPDPGAIVGVVSDAPPSSLALLAAGVAGMATRRARRQERIKFFQTDTSKTCIPS